MRIVGGVFHVNAAHIRDHQAVFGIGSGDELLLLQRGADGFGIGMDFEPAVGPFRIGDFKEKDGLSFPQRHGGFLRAVHQDDLFLNGGGVFRQGRYAQRRRREQHEAKDQRKQGFTGLLFHGFASPLQNFGNRGPFRGNPRGARTEKGPSFSPWKYSGSADPAPPSRLRKTNGAFPIRGDGSDRAYIRLTATGSRGLFTRFLPGTGKL